MSPPRPGVFLTHLCITALENDGGEGGGGEGRGGSDGFGDGDGVGGGGGWLVVIVDVC